MYIDGVDYSEAEVAVILSDYLQQIYQYGGMSKGSIRVSLFDATAEEFPSELADIKDSILNVLEKVEALRIPPIPVQLSLFTELRFLPGTHLSALLLVELAQWYNLRGEKISSIERRIAASMCKLERVGDYIEQFSNADICYSAQAVLEEGRRRGRLFSKIYGVLEE